MKTITVALTSLLFLASCESSDSKRAALEQKDATQITGKALFTKNCAECHGSVGQGLSADWRKTNADGKYPTPPLNGTAHTWHHAPSLLLNTINNGGEKTGGWMPPFKNKLSDSEKLALLEYVFSLWPKKIQDQYNTRFK